MKKVIGMLFASTFIFIPSLANTQVLACSCLTSKDVSYAVSKAKAVFSGKVVAINGAKITFTVERIWKGHCDNQVILTDFLINTDCAANFKLNEQYLVFASRGRGKRILYGVLKCVV